MSQYWHGYWTDDAFAPKRLRNWEVSKWYPSLPNRHCITTKFIADNNGHILDGIKKDKHLLWGTYKVHVYDTNKGTWDLPKKITRNIAKELSITPQYKKDSWEYKKKHQKLYKKIEQIKTKQKIEIMEQKSPKDTAENQTDKQSCIFVEKK